VQAAIERLPSGQRAVLILRDMEDCAAEEACALLGITAENQRVLLHRARGRIRAAVDALVGGEPAPVARTSEPARRRPRSAPLGRCIQAVMSIVARWLPATRWMADAAWS
jgi:hypothetical protein